ncbi:MAG: hypothetical protein ACRENE_29715 [Polyangiaceae bacterium]
MVISAYIEIAAGSTAFGLGTGMWSAGPLVEGVAGPFRFGGGIRNTLFRVDRVTESGGGLYALDLGLLGRVSIDLVPFSPVQSSEFAFFLFVNGSADLTGVLGVAGGAGVRL